MIVFSALKKGGNLQQQAEDHEFVQLSTVFSTTDIVTMYITSMQQ
jgi:hypothetical protein